MSRDRVSFDSTPITIGALVRIVVVLCAVVAATSTAVHQLWPPSLSDSDRRDLVAATKALADLTTSAQNATRATMSAREDFRCGMVEMRAHFDAADDLGPKATPDDRKRHRYSVAAKALAKSPGCTVPRFEPIPE